MALRPFLLLLLAATLLITQTEGIGSSASDCCLKHSQKVIPSNVVTSYRLQGPESGCLVPAVVFTTKRKRKICASPDDSAVKKLMKQLDKKAKNDKNKDQTQRPKGKSKKQRRQRV
ncbi:PREDICTED: C-C motif chemokine 21-like [Sturnus vulgaris]|uniref:C-C motif chemokine 21-like n=1 Tax=Sturnus vulgaris TaxID=9172 RepID=UPI00071AA94B|nr:PREDICTED: C-C motif chemokine 21-like [Sturnus vulgaris]